MHAEDRRQLIVDEVRRKGRVSIGRVAVSFDVTPETVRRDLIELEQRGALRRIHGGALALERVHAEPEIAERVRQSAEEKQAIARAAVALLPEDGGSVLLDAGTTTGALIECFPADRRLTVVTNALPHALRLATFPLVTVVVLGGLVRSRTLANVGDHAVRALADYHTDVAFIAANGVSETGCSTPDLYESAIKRAMVHAADRVVALVDHTKFGQEHLCRFADLADLDAVITDQQTESDDLQPFEVAGVEVIRA